MNSYYHNTKVSSLRDYVFVVDSLGLVEMPVEFVDKGNKKLINGQVKLYEENFRDR
jgi:hypothetical protein